MEEIKLVKCPNCGAENSHTDNCEYCGTALGVNDTGKGHDQTEIHGFHKADIDNRVLIQTYDEFTDTTETYFKYSDRSFIKTRCYILEDGNQEYHEDSISISYWQVGWEGGFVLMGGCLSDCIIQADNHNFEVFDGTFDDDEERLALSTIGSASSIKIRCGKFGEDLFVDEDGIIWIQMMIRVLYHTFYDKTMFTDSTQQLFVSSKDVVRNCAINRRKQKAKNEDKQNMEGSVSPVKIIIFAVILLWVLSLLIRLLT